MATFLLALVLPTQFGEQVSPPKAVTLDCKVRLPEHTTGSHAGVSFCREAENAGKASLNESSRLL